MESNAGPSASVSALDVRGLDVGYDGQLALEHLDVEVPRGSMTAVVGPNGAGKSTFFKALVGLLDVRAGQVYVLGKPLAEGRKELAYIPQREDVDWHFPVNVKDVVAMGRFGSSMWKRRLSKADEMLIERSMELLGIRDLADRPIQDLSGGQQQRVFIARALALEPMILLMDEPFNGVDAPTVEALLRVLADLKKGGMTVLVATHDLSMVAGQFDYALLLNRRRIAFGRAAEVFTPETMLQTFGGQALITKELTAVDQCCGPETVQERS